MTGIEQTLSKQAPAVNGVNELLAQITPTSMAVTALIIVLGYGITWWVKRIFSERDLQHKVPNWVNILMRMLLPLLLWLFAHVAMEVYHQQELSAIWFEFLAWLFGAWFMIRLFLYVVRRALPAGAGRSTIERSAMVFIWGIMFLDYIGKLDGVLRKLDSWSVTLGKSHISVLDCLTLVLTLMVLWLITQWLSHEIENALLNRPKGRLAEMDLSARMVLVRFLNGILLVVAVLFSLSAAGIDLTFLSVFGGALGVGIGLGLQKIASNYVSGFVMLLERGIRIGDLISTSDGTRGIVRTINSRYTLIEGPSGDEILMPNENLVINNVVNWTLRDKKNWLSTQIPVNYDIDLEFIMEKIAQAVEGLPRVANDPPPRVLLSSISDKGYILEITWWLIDPENGRLAVISDVNLAAWRVLREHEVDVFTLRPVQKPVAEESVPSAHDAPA